MTSVYICRSIPIDQDSRVQRYREILLSAGHNVKVIQWGGVPGNDLVVSPLPRIRGNRFVNLFLTPLFSIWLFLYLVIKCNKDYLVVAVDLDTALPTFLASAVKKFKYIFDIADPFSLCRLNSRVKVIDRLEGFIARRARLAIIPSECRRVFYSQSIDFCVIENVPSVMNMGTRTSHFKSDRLQVGYFGNLEPDYRGLELLISIVLARDDITLHVGGTGGLTEKFLLEAEKNPGKIKFYGRFSPKELPALASECDLMFAFYSLTKEHHKYVAANKLYEHLLLGLPVLTNEGTNFATDILSWQSGWAVSENAEALNSFFEFISINKSIVSEKSVLARKLWERNYKNYWSNSLDVKKFLKLF